MNRREYTTHPGVFFLVCVSLIINACRKCRGHGVVAMVTGHVEAQHQFYSSDSFFFYFFLSTCLITRVIPTRRTEWGLSLCVLIPSHPASLHQICCFYFFLLLIFTECGNERSVLSITHTPLFCYRFRQLVHRHTHTLPHAELSAATGFMTRTVFSGV